MDYPPDWETCSTIHSNLGHQEQGRTIVVHSLAVLPEFQKRGFGKIVLNSYLQRMESAGIADRVSLIAHDELIEYYRQLGFLNKGKSQVKFGAGGWNDMRYQFQRSEPAVT